MGEEDFAVLLDRLVASVTMDTSGQLNVLSRPEYLLERANVARRFSDIEDRVLKMSLALHQIDALVSHKVNETGKFWTTMEKGTPREKEVSWAYHELANIGGNIRNICNLALRPNATTKR